MELPIYQVDAFSSEVFKGNPAAVVPLEEWLPDDILQNIAVENNLSETAYFVETEDGVHLRWFTPSYEVDLCGHATLASAFVYLTQLHPDKNSVTFQTNVAGDLTITKNTDGFVMDLPARGGEKIDIDDIPEIVLKALGGHNPIAAYKARDLMLVYDDASIVKNMTPDYKLLEQYPSWVCVTAKSDQENIDFISRFFCADDSLLEDPVTGSAHCTLVPYWAEKFDKNTLRAYQASKRGGHLVCELKNERVFLTGQAALYLKGSIYV